MPPFGPGTRSVYGLPAVANSLPSVRGFADGESGGLFPPVVQIAGVSRDSTGAILGGCTCTLFRVDGTDFIQEQRTISDPTTGAYVFNVSPTAVYRVTFDLAGAPIRAGITLKSLSGV